MLGPPLMRIVVALVLASCTSPDPYAVRTLAFGPYTLQPQEEVIDKCVQITLHNDEPVYINAVELTTGPGFHHSNWFFVPEHVFPGEDGTYTCDDRSFNLGAAAVLGGVFFAQSTQSTHEVQQFPTGMVIKLPPKTKLVAQIHLFNTGDEPLTITPKIAYTPLREADVTQTLAGVSFEYHPLSLPARMQSRFSVTCDLAPLHEMNLGVDPNFKMYYALAHYHKLGTQLAFEAVEPDGTAATIYSTQGRVGDTLGGRLEPPFDMTGYTKLRLTCDYYNNSDATVYYGNGAGEMCVFLAFSDSPRNWAGGSLDMENPDPGLGVNMGGVMTYTRSCQVFTTDATY